MPYKVRKEGLASYLILPSLSLHVGSIANEQRAQSTTPQRSDLCYFRIPQIKFQNINSKEGHPDSYAELWSHLALCAFYGNIIHMMGKI